MTVVIAASSGKQSQSSLTVEFSYMPPYEEVDDYLQKLYQIGDRLILGFSGPLKELMR